MNVACCDMLNQDCLINSDIYQMLKESELRELGRPESLSSAHENLIDCSNSSRVNRINKNESESELEKINSNLVPTEESLNKTSDSKLNCLHTIDIDDDVNCKISKEIQKLINEYKPNKIKNTSNLKMRIILNNEKPRLGD